MKLKMLIVAAGIMALPAMASAQNPTGTQLKDSTEQPKPVPPTMDGEACPWGCPSSSGYGGLTGPQFLALQQELRDGKCGLRHVTGRLDAATRTAIRNCARKLNVEATAPAVLVAMNIGYSASDVNMSGTRE